MPIHQDTLRQAMRQWATGVTIVSACADGVHHGMTVSSFTSLSLTPPLLLISLEQITKTHRLVESGGAFAITILGESQQDISDIFAGRVPDLEDRFAGLETFTLISGAPLLKQGLAWFDCRVVNAFPAGNHTVYVGEVLAAASGSGNGPLLYYDRSYRKLEVR